MKICHMSSAHKSDDIRILQKECVSLAKVETNEVYYVVYGDSYKYKKVNIVGVKHKPTDRLKRIILGSKNIYKKALEINADVYHLHDPELLPYAKKLKKKGKKIIFDSHELYYELIKEKYYIPKFLRNIAAFIYKIIEDNACKYLDVAIFPCPVGGKHPFEGRVRICEYVDNLPLISEKSLCHEKRTIKSYDNVCCVGSLTEERGIEVLIDACYEAEVRLILAGEFSPASFKKKVMSKESFINVDYRGKCSREEVKEIYRESFIGVSNILRVGQYPIIENLPTKVYEYMLNSMPFLISNFNYAEKFINRYGCGVVIEPESISDIKNAIHFLINNRKEAIEMGEKGNNVVITKLNWNKEEKNLYAAYNKVEEPE